VRLSRKGPRLPARRPASAGSLLKASKAATKVVVTDSVFSMDGNLAPLPQLLALCEQYGAWLVVDDAHGFGTLGARPRRAGTLQSALAVSGLHGHPRQGGRRGGAFVAAHETVIETLIQKARPYIFTTATPPALAHALLTSLDLLEGEEGVARRAHLQAGGTIGRGLRLSAGSACRRTAIQPIVIGDNAETMRRRRPVRAGPVGRRHPSAHRGGGNGAFARDAVGSHNSADVAKLIALNALERTEMSWTIPIVLPQTAARAAAAPAALQLLRHRHRYRNRQDLISSAMLHALVHAACAPAA
jgi:8-amino-7-oxononanoate synthase